MKLPGPTEHPGEGPTSLAVPQTRQVSRIPGDPVGAAISDLGQTLVRGGERLHQEYEREKRRIDKYRVEEAYTELRNFRLDISLGEEGFKNVKGGDAIKRPLLKEYSDRFQKKVDEISKNLSEDQTKAFHLRSDAEHTDFNHSVLSHVTGERRVHQKQVLDSTIETEENAAALNWSNPSSALVSIQRVKAAVKDFAEANGLDEKMRKAAELKALAGIHASVVSRAIDAGNPDYAELWIKTHKKEIDANTLVRLEKATKTGRQIKLAQSESDTLIGSGLTETEALAKVREKYTGEDRKEIEQEIRSRYAENRRIQREDEDNAADEAYRIASTGAKFSEIPVSIRRRMDGRVLESLRSHIESRDRGTTSKRSEQQKDRYYELNQMSVHEPEKFLRENLRAYSLNDADFKELVRLQRDMGSADDKTQRKLALYKKGQAYGRLMMQSIGMSVKPPKPGTREAKRQGEFWSAQRERLDRLYEEKGGRVSTDDIKNATSPLFTEVWIDKWGPDPSERFGRLLPEERAKAYIPYDEIPPEDMKKILKLLKKQGRLAEEKVIEQTYYMMRITGKM